MISSVGCEYAVRALVRLATRVPPGKYCLLREILEGVNLPQPFVGKVFQTLVRADILTSAKGRGGGFALRRSPEEITLRDITKAIDGPFRLDRWVPGLADSGDASPSPLQQQWIGIRRQIEHLLDSTTLAVLVEHFKKP